MKITIDLPRKAAIDLLRQLERQLRPSKKPISVAENENDATLAMLTYKLSLPKVTALTARAYHLLANAEQFRTDDLGHTIESIRTVEDLCLTEVAELQRQPNSGGKTIGLIQDALANLGLRLGMTKSEIEDYRQGHFKLKR